MYNRSNLTFEQLTREHDVRFYTGFIKTGIFETLFAHLKSKASSMRYWHDEKRTLVSTKYNGQLNVLEEEIYQTALSVRKTWTPKKTFIKDRISDTLIKLRLALLQHDLAFKFGISVGKVSEIFITWFKLLSKELGVLVIWPSKLQVQKTATLFQEVVSEDKNDHRLYRSIHWDPTCFRCP